MDTMKSSGRRKFLTNVIKGAALGSIGGILPSFSAKSYGRIAGSNERVKLAAVGVNSRGLALARNFARQTGSEVTYVCDVDDRVIDKGLRNVEKIQKYRPQAGKDFRKVLEDKQLDGIIVATPDHWHAAAALFACKAGKHVYLEKPFSCTPAEGELLMQAANKYKESVIQVGSQKRSWPNILRAIDEIRNGAIGRPYFGKAWYANKRKSIGYGKETKVPAYLDYDLWQGPVPRRPYRDNLIHYNWHWFWHYGKGELPANGVHTLDLLRWGLGVDYPTSVVASGGRYAYKDDQETPDTMSVSFEFGGKAGICWEGRSCNAHPVSGSQVGVEFYGESGAMFIDGNAYTIFDQDQKVVKDVKDDTVINPLDLMDPSEKLDAIHIDNFLEAIRKGVKVNSDVIESHKSTLLCQLGNIAFQRGEKLSTDPANGRILNNKKAMELWDRAYEPGWELRL